MCVYVQHTLRTKDPFDQNGTFFLLSRAKEILFPPSKNDKIFQKSKFIFPKRFCFRRGVLLIVLLLAPSLLTLLLLPLFPPPPPLDAAAALAAASPNCSSFLVCLSLSSCVLRLLGTSGITYDSTLLATRTKCYGRNTI